MKQVNIGQWLVITLGLVIAGILVMGVVIAFKNPVSKTGDRLQFINDSTMVIQGEGIVIFSRQGMIDTIHIK